MTGAIVTQSGQMPFALTGSPGMTGSSKGDFKEVFQGMTEKSDENMQTEGQGKANLSGVRVKDEKNHVVSQQTAKTKVEVETELSEKELEDAMSCLNELKAEIMKTLSVSEEELESMMDSLGLSNADLFTKEGIVELVMGFTGIENNVELLTNEDAYSMISQLAEFAEGMAKEMQTDFKLTEADLRTMLEQLEQQMSADETQISGLRKQDGEGTVSREEANNQENLIVENEVTQNTANQQPKSDTNAERGMEQNMMGSQVVNQTPISANAEVAFQETLGAQDVEAQEIFEQITEYMRTNVNADVSEIEMQLNPENLGKLQIHVSSKDGVLSAQLIAQNELVKGILETQLIQLKEQFEQQGVKVEAVEVAVASYSFDQGLNQDAQQYAGDSKQARKTVIRRINLNEELVEELTEEEKIAAEMMAANGNTVDYMA